MREGATKKHQQTDLYHKNLQYENLPRALLKWSVDNITISSYSRF